MNTLPSIRSSSTLTFLGFLATNGVVSGISQSPASLLPPVSLQPLTNLKRLRSSPLSQPWKKRTISPSRTMASSPSSTPGQKVVNPGDGGSSGAGDTEDPFLLIKAHQEKAKRLPPIEEVKTVLYHATRGMLSTMSNDHAGYPSGSVVDFACDRDGSPVLAVSSLAFHAKNLAVNPKCSLLVARDPDDRTDLVTTLYGDATPVPEAEREGIRAAYLNRHPDAFWVDFGDFYFLRLEPKAVRYVSGVATALLGSGEFGTEEFKAAKVDPIFQFSKPIASHMNKDHGEDTKAIVEHFTLVPVDFAYMLDVDSLGFYVKAGVQGSTVKLRVPFPWQAKDRKDVKTLIVEMLQAARATGST